MPHLTIEYTANVKEAEHIADLFLPMHHLLVQSLTADIKNCKTKAIKIENYLCAEGNKGIVMMGLVLRKGRDKEVIEKAAGEIMKLAEDFFSESIAKNVVSVSLEIYELPYIYLR